MAARSKAPLPSLGGVVCDFIEAYCVHGPGDVRGQEVVLSPEQQNFIYRAYEVWPKGHPRAGRRRWPRAVYSRRKGVSKSELAAFLISVELLGDVRCDGWRKVGKHYEPVARPVTSPFIPVAATSEDQAEDTLWGAFYSMASEGPMVDEFNLDIVLDQITDPHGGKAKLITSKSITKDGGKPTFSPRDETHLWYTPDLRLLNETLIRNLAKRPHAQPWGASFSTMFKPGQGSVAELEWNDHEADKKKAESKRRLLFDHRDFSGFDLDDEKELKAGLAHASGDAISYTDIDELVEEYTRAERSDPGSGKRYWGNFYTKDGSTAFDLRAWDDLVDDDLVLEPDDPIALGFDGSESDDSTALYACRLSDMAIFKLGLWERPQGPEGDGWRVPRADVAATLEFAHAMFQPVVMFADPWGWREELGQWRKTYEDDRVLDFPCNSYARMVPATHDFLGAIGKRSFAHETDDDLRTHMGHVVKQETRVRIESNVFGWIPNKRSPQEKIDAVLAVILARAAALHALAEGMEPPNKERRLLW